MRKFMRSNFSAFILAFALIAFSGVPAFAADSVEYVERSVDANGNVISQTRTANKVNPLISKSEVVLEDSKWYYPYSKTVEITSITVSGDAHLILSKGHTLTVKKGIYVKDGSSLTIYGQPNGDGTLVTTGEEGQAGIGSHNGKSSSRAPISITIHGGNITATGGEGAAGIGVFGTSAYNKSITIYGGTITATGGKHGAGIGNNVSTLNTTITIYGGEITAAGGTNGAGIGGGMNNGLTNISCGTVNIYGGTITATGSRYRHVAALTDFAEYYPAGIGGGNRFANCAVNIYGGNITAKNYRDSTSESDYGYGIRGQITLSYKNANDLLYATNYGGTVTVADGKSFIVDGTEISGTVEVVKVEKALSQTETEIIDTCPALDGKTLTPQSSYKVNIGTTGITASTAKAFTGETVTLSPAEGYTLTGITVDGAAITGNTFTMPAKDVTVTGTATPITYTITYNLDGGTVSTANPTTYTVETETFTLKNPTKSGYYFVGWSAFGGGVKSINLMILKGSTGDRTYIANWEQSPVALGWTDSYNADGTEERPYLISDSYGWDFLVNELKTKNYSNYSGKIFKLTDDITVTEMLGTNGKEFSGIFDGNGKTLTFDYENATALIIAPFKYVKGATIKDLTVAGTINSSRKDGGNKYIGGLIERVNEGETTIENCKFVGKLLATDSANAYGGGFVVHNSGTLTINGSLYAPAELEDGETEPSKDGTATFARNSTYGTSTITNSYYTRTLGTAQGEQIYTVTADYDITIELAGDSENVLTYDGTIYAGSGKTLSLTISGGNTKDGYTFRGYKASAGTLTESGGKYSLTMPEGNVTISAEFVENISYIDADGQNATTSDYTVLTSSMTSLTAGTYVVKENVTLSALTLTGDVNLILCDGATLSVTGNVSGANSLVVYGQDSGTGTLTAANITLTGNKNLSVYGGNLTAGTISVAGTVTVKRATVNNETYDANGYRTTSYTVTFDSKGGSAIDSQTLKFKYGEIVKATKPADPTRDNYGFVEWQLNGTAYDFGTAVTGDMTLTAKWTATEYTITYNGTDEATFTTANPTKYTVETETFTLNNPTKNGSTFAGWTGTGLSGATMTVTITKGLTGNREYTATWRKTGGKSQEDDPAKPTFRSHSLILEGEIGVNFYMNLPSLSGVDYEDHDKCYMEFDINGDKSNALKYKDANISYTENGKTYYGFRCYISSVQMAETITAVLHYGDNLTVSQDYSVQEYLDAILDGDFSGAAKDLMIAIQNYGYYAQQMLSKANNWTIGDKYAAMERASQSDYGATEISRAKEGTAQYAISRDVGNSQIQEVQYSLLLDSKTTVNVYLEVKEGYTGTVTATLDGGTANVATKLSSREYFVQIRDIPAHELSTIHTIGVTAGESFTVKVAALSYVYTVLNSTAEKIGEVDITTMRNGVTALYEYYDAAMTYAGRN